MNDSNKLGQAEYSAKKALIYCRVSDKVQVTDGSGLDSQEHRCRQHADLKGFEVEEVFPDDVSGGGDFMLRKGMVSLLSYLDKNQHQDYVVIFDDLKRLARDREFHFKLRAALAARGAIVECLNFRFEDTPEGEFVETVFAAQGQLERQQNARQTKQKMRARVEKGYYVFGEAPLGYKYIKSDEGGKVLAPSEPNASLVKEAFEGLASGRFQNINEIQRFFAAHPSTITRKNGNPRNWQSVNGVLRSPVYAGYFNVKSWGIHFKEGKHEPLISLELWKKVQTRLDGKINMPARKDLNKDFPLRGCVECASCGSLMTASWSRGQYKHYAYYFCQQKGCPDRKTNIRKEKIESELETILRGLQPTPTLTKLALDMMTRRWETVDKNMKSKITDTKKSIALLEQKTTKLVDLIMGTETPAIVSTYERQLAKIEEQKAVLRENMTLSAKPRYSFSETYRTVCAFLANPWKLWASGNVEYQRMLLRMVFPKRLAYCPKEGYRTAEIAEPVRLFQLLSARDSEMVGVTRIELVTSSMSTRRSPAELYAHFSVLRSE